MAKLHVIARCLLIAASFASGNSNAASPRDDFESDRLLESAMAEIHGLAADQLEAVIDYIASCNPIPAPERNFWCERGAQIVDIKTASARSFARIRHSLFIIDKVIPWQRRGVGDREAKDIDRRISIYNSLSRAASERYMKLQLPPAPK